jgi:hypothetical protein
MMGRFVCITLVGLTFGAAGASAQESSIPGELDAFWMEVVRSVEDWDLNAQRATYHRGCDLRGR